MQDKHILGVVNVTQSEVIQEPLPLKPRILVKPSLGQKTEKQGQERFSKSILRFTRTTEFFTKILGLKGKGS